MSDETMVLAALAYLISDHDLLDSEYTTLDQNGRLRCDHCGQTSGKYESAVEARHDETRHACPVAVIERAVGPMGYPYTPDEGLTNQRRTVYREAGDEDDPTREGFDREVNSAEFRRAVEARRAAETIEDSLAIAARYRTERAERAAAMNDDQSDEPMAARPAAADDTRLRNIAVWHTSLVVPVSNENWTMRPLTAAELSLVADHITEARRQRGAMASLRRTMDEAWQRAGWHAERSDEEESRRWSELRDLLAEALDHLQ